MLQCVVAKPRVRDHWLIIKCWVIIGKLGSLFCSTLIRCFALNEIKINAVKYCNPISIFLRL